MAIVSGTELGGIEFINILYVDITTLIGDEQLIEGSYYKITDRGDNGILVRATSPKNIDTEAIRFMLCPKYYDLGSFEGNTWIGVWNPTLTPSIGDLVIWGGLVWESTTGDISSFIDDTHLDPTDWLVISKSISVYYEERQFNIRYDFNNDWIELQSDNFGNICGIDYISFSQGYGSDFNTTDLTDWNLTRSSSFIFANNKGLGFWNNSNVNYIINCNVIRGIKNNYNVDSFQYIDNVGTIDNNYNITEGITYCSDIAGSITGNHDIFKIYKINDCSGISNCNNITFGMSNNNSLLNISNVTNVDNISNHSSKLFTIIMNFNDTPLLVGIPQYLDVLFDQVVISEIVALGDSLDPLIDIGALISIGIDSDDPTYIMPTSLTNYNTGIKESTLSNKATISNRKIIVEATVEDVTVGTLSIVIKHS